MKSQTFCFHYRNMSTFLKSIAISRLPRSLTACGGALEPGSWSVPWAMAACTCLRMSSDRGTTKTCTIRLCHMSSQEARKPGAHKSPFSCGKTICYKISSSIPSQKKTFSLFFMLRQESDTAVFSCPESIFSDRVKEKQLQLYVTGPQSQDYMQKFLLPLAKR